MATGSAKIVDEDIIGDEIPRHGDDGAGSGTWIFLHLATAAKTSLFELRDEYRVSTNLIAIGTRSRRQLCGIRDIYG